MKSDVRYIDVTGFPESDPVAIHSFDSGREGPQLLILAGIHAGTEPMPVYAAQTILKKLQDGTITLEKGALTMVPLANPMAHKLGQLFYHKNLNRMISPEAPDDIYEGWLAKHIIAPLIDASEYVLDLHTTRSETPAYAIQEGNSKAAYDFAYGCGAGRIIQGWGDMYDGRTDLSIGDTGTYSVAKGKVAVTFECGHNPDPAAIAVAECAMLNALAYLDMVAQPQAVEFEPEIVKAVHLMTMEEGLTFTKKFVNFEAVKKGDTILVDKTTGKMAKCAPIDGVILLPKLDAEAGAECAYFGEITQYFRSGLSPYGADLQPQSKT